MCTFTAVRLRPPLVGGGPSHFQAVRLRPRFGGVWPACSHPHRYIYDACDSLGVGLCTHQRYVYFRDTLGEPNHSHSGTSMPATRLVVGLPTFTAVRLHPRLVGGGLFRFTALYLCLRLAGGGPVHFHSGTFTSATRWGWVRPFPQRYVYVRTHSPSHATRTHSRRMSDTYADPWRTRSGPIPDPSLTHTGQWDTHRIPIPIAYPWHTHGPLPPWRSRGTQMACTQHIH